MHYQCSYHHTPVNDPYHDWARIERQERFSAAVAGFLSIGNKDGYLGEEGNTHELGFRWVRFTFLKFADEQAVRFPDFTQSIKKAVRSFLPADVENTLPRSYLDMSISGFWHRHSAVRLHGTVTKEWNPNTPRFEVIIDSSGKPFPFYATVYDNWKDLEERVETLQLAKLSTSHEATNAIFHDRSLHSPEKYHERYQKIFLKDLDIHSVRLLEGLDLLTKAKKKPQRIGNCWMKQVKRSVLVALFFELLTEHSELKPKACYEKAEFFYKEWKKSVYSLVQENLERVDCRLSQLAIAKMERLSNKK
ncbi:MAG: hypothetical protein H7A37_06550 [Chlamydiales bacterium]|nr:hypothetical protein [Chlamydiia bacterium]MCP5507942.1 hypothetical protein [Chlamydiales bacterium]